MKNPQVSIYCLTYNQEKYIRSALEGFVNQKTNFDYEVLIHDDASTDGTSNIIKEYQEKYPDIIKPIFQKENQYSQGISITDKYIFPIMKGKYVAICEGDDYWIDENKLQIQYDFLENHPEYSACVHNTYAEDLVKKTKQLMFNDLEDRDIEFLEVLQEGGKCFHLNSVMFRREYAFNRPVFFKKSKSVGDYPLAIYLTFNGKVRFINRAMSVYRMFTEGSWSRAHLNDINKIARTYQNSIEMLKSVDEYTGYKYSKEINKVILQTQYRKDEITGNFRALGESYYKGIWKDEKLSFRFKRKLKYFLGKYFNISFR